MFVIYNYSFTPSFNNETFGLVNIVKPIRNIGGLFLVFSAWQARDLNELKTDLDELQIDKGCLLPKDF